MSARTHELPESKPNDTLHPLSGGGDAAGPDLELKSNQDQEAGVCVCVRERERERERACAVTGQTGSIWPAPMTCVVVDMIVSELSSIPCVSVVDIVLEWNRSVRLAGWKGLVCFQK